LKYVDKIPGSFIDRHIQEPNLEPIDVIMQTLDAESFLERSMLSIYKEIPVRQLFVNDGGSSDKTLDIIKKFPRTKIYARPDIQTFGKGLEFLLSLVETEWFAIMDSDIDLQEGWYDEMCKYKSKGDVLENNKTILSYHFSREHEAKLKENTRPYDWTHIVRKAAVKNFQCDDDYMWRDTDIMFRTVVEKSGFKWKKIPTTEHIHNQTDGFLYSSDNQKNFYQTQFNLPERIVTDKEKEREMQIKQIKGAIKYIDPESNCVLPFISQYEELLNMIDRKWIEENGPSWLKYYDKYKSNKLRKMKKFLRRSIKSFLYLLKK